MSLTNSVPPWLWTCELRSRHLDPNHYIAWLENSQEARDIIPEEEREGMIERAKQRTKGWYNGYA